MAQAQVDGAAPPVQQQAPVAPLGGLLDLRGISKPASYDGSEEAWSEWRFMFENWCALLGVDTHMTEVLALPAPPRLDALGPVAQQVAKTLFHVLCLHFKGRALATVRLAERFNGLQA